ncbi:MAG: tRNA (adenosine(37)-N6)-threonylcarbamoyltransferase complex dimerization subunit type 1 TsaB [Gemmatimonadota bacterium]
MLSLALETSTPLGSVALGEGDAVLAESALSVRATHSETLMPEVERLLELCGRELSEIRAVVAGAGPGSFTGVRIAAALAKGFCFGSEASLYAYSSLLAVAAGTGLSGGVCALVDARRGEVYAAAYRRVAPPELEAGPTALPVEELLAALSPCDWRFVGTGARVHRERIVAAGGRVLPGHLAHPRGSALLWLARRWPELGRVDAPASWEPEYVRRSGARRGTERATS